MEGDHTTDDLFSLPGLPRHTELIDGGLVFARPQNDFHSVAVDLLTEGLRARRPPACKVSRQMTVILDERNGPEPDVCVVRSEAYTGLNQMSYRASDLLLAVEVVGPGSRLRDRTTKPQKYAAVGIPHFWRVEMSEPSDRPVVHVYELDSLTRTYVSVGIYRDRIKVDKPYPVDIDLTAIDAL